MPRTGHEAPAPRAVKTTITLATVGLLVAVAGWGAPVAHAHGEASPFIRTFVDRVEVAGPGLEVTTEAGQAAALRLRNRGPVEAELAAPGGEPFLRVGPRGTFANVSSLYWYQSGNPDGLGTLPPEIRPGSAPRWVRMSRAPEWTWFEHRLHPVPPNVPPDLARSQRRQRLAEWTVPVRLDGRPGEIQGHVEFRPSFGTVALDLESPSAPLPDVLAAAVPGPGSSLLVQNEGRRAVIVRGRAGEPFARIGPRGAEVNLFSATYQDDQRLRGRSAAGADPAARPRWRRVSEAPYHLWFDSRTRGRTAEPPLDTQERREPATLARWTIPLERGRERADVRGQTRWVPAPRRTSAAPASERETGPGGLTLGLILLALTALVVALVAGLRRRASPSLTAG